LPPSIVNFRMQAELRERVEAAAVGFPGGVSGYVRAAVLIALGDNVEGPTAAGAPTKPTRQARPVRAVMPAEPVVADTPELLDLQEQLYQAEKIEAATLATLEEMRAGRDRANADREAAEKDRSEFCNRSDLVGMAMLNAIQQNTEQVSKATADARKFSGSIEHAERSHSAAAAASEALRGNIARLKARLSAPAREAAE
jgi:hypothetical protein